MVQAALASHASSDAVPNAANHLFISDNATNRAVIFTYPAGALVGAVTGLSGPNGECVNPTKHWVYITNTGASNIYVVTYSGTAVAVLSDQGLAPISCSYNVLSNKLAVVNFTTAAPANVAIYPSGGLGSPSYYFDPPMKAFYFVGYKPNGVLYLDGISTGLAFQLERLVAPTFTTMTLVMGANPPITFPGNVQWSGTSLYVGDQPTNRFIQFAIGPPLVATAGTGSTFGGACDIKQFFINPAGTKIIGPDPCAAPPDAFTYPFPAGGAPIAPSITAPLTFPVGAALVQ